MRAVLLLQSVVGSRVSSRRFSPVAAVVPSRIDASVRVDRQYWYVTQRYVGYNGWIQINEDSLQICHTGRVAKLGGLPTDLPQTHQLSEITDVSFNAASRLSNGTLTIAVNALPLPRITAGSAASDRNTVMFRKKDTESFSTLAAWLKALAEHNRAQLVSAPPVDVPTSSPESVATAEADGERMTLAFPAASSGFDEFETARREPVLEPSDLEIQYQRLRAAVAARSRS